jgi:hypothetical protein
MKSAPKFPRIADLVGHASHTLTTSAYRDRPEMTEDGQSDAFEQLKH